MMYDDENGTTIDSAVSSCSSSKCISDALSIGGQFVRQTIRHMLAVMQKIKEPKHVQKFEIGRRCVDSLFKNVLLAGNRYLFSHIKNELHK